MHKHFILHELKKTNKSKETTFIGSKQEVVNDQTSASLIIDLHTAITNSMRKTYGVFSKAGTSYFKQEFDNYLKKRNYNLLQSSKAYVGDDNQQSLKTYLSSEILATGGHILIIDYTIDGKQYFTISMISNKMGRAVNITNGIPTLMNTEQIDFRELDLACRIDIEKYKSGQTDQNYLCFISGTDNISKYFVNFIGCEKFNQNKDNSRKAINIITELTKDSENKEDLRKRAYQYCDSKIASRNPVNLYDMSIFVFGESERDKIVKYANDNGIEVDHTFSIHKQEMKRLISFKFKGDWIESFAFDKSHIGTDILINTQKNEVTLKNVTKLIAELKNEDQ